MSQFVKPCLTFDTNILMDVLLDRDGGQASMLVELAEEGLLELVIPEYVLLEFQGTARRELRRERHNLTEVRRMLKSWLRCGSLDEPAMNMRDEARRIAHELEETERNITRVVEQIETAAIIKPHTQELHFLGDLRFLRGDPPDRPRDGIKDCRIYEAILALAREENEREIGRPRYLVTKDSDFDYPTLREELRELGWEIHNKPGKLYGDIRRSLSVS